MAVSQSIKNYLCIQKKQQFLSLLGGATILILWLVLYQLKTEPQVPFSDITDLASESSQENATDVTQTIAFTDSSSTQSNSASQSQSISTTTDSQTVTNPQDSTPINNSTTPQTTPAQTPKKVKRPPTGIYKNGVYQASSDIPWGTVTVQVTVANGKWADVQLLSIPDSPPSQYAASYLAKQALKAQGDNINGVSGATYMSDGFRDDLTQIVSQSKI